SPSVSMRDHVYAVGSSSPYSHSALMSSPRAQRPGSNAERSTLVALPSRSHSATQSPTAGEILKPIPEKPHATKSLSTPGQGPISGRKSGLRSYTPVTPRQIAASSSAGTRPTARATSSARVSDEGDCGNASGSAPRFPQKSPTRVRPPTSG